MDKLFRYIRKLKIKIFSILYTNYLKMRGCKIGHNVIFLGKLEIRGSAKNISIGSRSRIQKNVCFNTMLYENKWGEINIGEKCLIGDGTIVSSAKKIEVGNKTEIAAYSYLVDHDHETIHSAFKVAPIILKRCVWLGTKTTVLKGVILEDDCVVGAGSIVTKSFNKRTIILGEAAKSFKN